MDHGSDDYYALLGVAHGVDGDELRRAWRRHALRWHPDRAGAAATATFQKLSVAYAVLSDQVARAAYDRFRGVTARAPQPSTDDTPNPPARRAPGVMLSRLRGPLAALLARGVARVADDGVIELSLDADEATHGGMIVISMRVPVHCPACRANAGAACARCGDARVVDDVFSAWLAVRPGVIDGTILTPSAWLPDMVHPVYFRVRLGDRP